ncbi:MAG: HIT family protein [Candidatus Nanohaloarchaea archaeon]|nr:HIT family protein [Candidatus Nanohaloarchaea archaeon]
MPQGEECPFCQLLQNEDQTFDVHESENFRAWLDINPRARGHTMIVPKEHVGGLEDVPGDELFQDIQAVAAKARKGLGAAGVSVVINDGEVAGQRLDHFYVQIFPRFEGEENEGAPAGAVFQPLEDAGEAQLEEWSGAMEEVELGGGPEGPAKEMLERKRGETKEEGGQEEEKAEEEPGRKKGESSPYRDGAEFR